MRRYLKYKYNIITPKTIFTAKTNNPQVSLDAKWSRRFFIPKEHDTLFWCYFLLKHGDKAYELMPHRNSLIEKRLKIECIQEIRTHKSILKAHKFDTLTNLESNLANDSFMHLATFASLCAIDNLHFLFIRKNTYFEWPTSSSSSDHPVYVVKELTDRKRYGFQVGDEEILQDIRSRFYLIDSLDKPVKALSAYKLADLKAICAKLGIEPQSKTKNELYELIVQYV